MRENEISKIVVDAAIIAHRALGGPGLLEGVYEEALVWEVEAHGLVVERQLSVPITYKGRQLGTPRKWFITLCTFALSFYLFSGESNGFSS